jgi:nicotinamide mononucleotide adenylyltransferase
MWQKKLHVKSSMIPKKDQFNLFIGRWQPLHQGHKELFNQVLESGGNVCIAIRDVSPDEKNPYEATDVYKNICKEYQKLIEEKRVMVIIIPDICSVDFGRGVGYDVSEWIPPKEIAEISATKIRENAKKTHSENIKL